MENSITLIDYGMGNLWSVQSAFEYLGAQVHITSDPEKIAQAKQLVLPGVGSFRKAIQTLQAKGIDKAIVSAVRSANSHIMGICLGMQLLAEEGLEDGLSRGLGLVPGRVGRFSKEELGTLKLPHIGFNRVYLPEKGRLFAGMQRQADFYFVHSYYVSENIDVDIKATANYGICFLAAFEHNNIFATQFHPEKSQTNGLRLLSNFLEASRA